MDTVISRLCDLVHDRRRTLLLVWLCLLVAAVPLALHQTDHLSAGNYIIPGSQSAFVDAEMKRLFPESKRAELAVLVWPRKGAKHSAIQKGIERVQLATEGMPGIRLTKRVKEVALFSADLGEPIILPLQASISEDQAQNVAETLHRRIGSSAASGEVELHLLGEGALWAGLDGALKKEVSSAEDLGFPLLLVVLIVVFGSMIAAALPIALAALAITVSGALIFLLSLVTELSIFVTNTASLFGLGVAIDYSLIILTRVRQEIRSGHTMRDAIQIALTTSGRTVIVSGLTVIAALLGTLAMPNATLHSMALGAVLVVAVAVVASVTVLPAVIAALGPDRVSGRWSRVSPGRLRKVARKGIWDRWIELVTSRPLVVTASVAAVLLVLASPALWMRTSTGALRQLSAKNETRIGFMEAEKVVGPGTLGPVMVLLSAQRTASHAELMQALSRTRSFARRLPDVHATGSTYFSKDTQHAILEVIPTVDAESPVAKGLVQTMRKRLPLMLRGIPVSATVGGTSAIQHDAEQQISSSIWKFMAVLLAISYVVLLFVLRSFVIPIKAIVMNLLSVGAGLGVLVAIFQWGILDSLLHYRSPGSLDSLTPPIVIAFVFGLSMDYEIFLVTRIRERWQVSGDPQRAVHEALVASAGAISSAALILVCALGVFVAVGGSSVKEIGVGIAVAIAVDATLIRLALVPATMEILGEWNWWWPSQIEAALQAPRKWMAARRGIKTPA